MDKAETMEFIWRNIILYYRMLLFTLRKFLRLQIFHKYSQRSNKGWRTFSLVYFKSVTIKNNSILR